MKVLLIGHTGTIGKAVHALLKSRGHKVITASRAGGDVAVDISNHHSILAMYKNTRGIEAVLVATGSTPFKPLEELQTDDFMAGWQSKALSQIDIVLTGLANKSIKSFTLTSGILSETPVAQGTVASTVNGALEKFVMAAAASASEKVRINVVSPKLLEESRDAYDAHFPGFPTTPAEEVAKAYIQSLEGIESGKVFKV